MLGLAFTYLSSDGCMFHVCSLLEITFPGDRGLFQWDDVPCPKAKLVQGRGTTSSSQHPTSLDLPMFVTGYLVQTLHLL